MNELPKEVQAGDEIEVQLAPLGDYPCHDGNPGYNILQRVTPEAVSRLAHSFSHEILVDLDHASETSPVTAAVSALKKRAEELEGCAKEKAADEFAAANVDKCAPAALKDAYLRDPALLDKDRSPVYWLYRCVQSHNPAALPSPLLLVSALLSSLCSMSNLSFILLALRREEK